MRSRSREQVRGLVLCLAVLCAAGSQAADKKGLTGMDRTYYKVHPMFHPYPNDKLPTQIISRFGPVGIGIELLQPAFRMRVSNVEEGAPADGILKKGQFIDSINGRVLKDMDPRQILGDIIANAEASDGVVRFIIRATKEAQPETVEVKIPVLGAYSNTWPLNCRKSERIVREMADYLKRTGANGMGLGHLFLLSTGDDSDLEFVRAKMQEIAQSNEGREVAGGYPWYIGYRGLSLCEYYLRTGDQAILHSIEAYAEQARRSIYNGSWGQKGGANYRYMAGGHMNAAGVHCVTFLLLAKQCGADVDEFTLQSSLKHFYRYAGHGAVSYGDGLPEATYTDNGKNGGLAFAMAAATGLTPDGETSVYAKARDVSAATSFYSTSWLLHGHTGGGIGEIWRGPAMGLLYDKSPGRYREFMNNRAWFLDISRRFDGSFGCVGGGRYDTPDSWAIGMALNYTVPRKKLRIYGAPKTEHCHTYPLPARPWGTAADETFLSLDAAPVRGGEPHDVDAETLVDDSSWPVLRKLRAEDVSEELVLKYIHHPDFNLRCSYAASQVRRLKRDDLTLELLRSEDARVRRAGLLSIDTTTMTDAVVEVLVDMVHDPDEAWWVAMASMEKLGAARAELIAPHVDRLVDWLKHDDWWLRRSAMMALTPVATDRRYYKKVLPIIGDLVATNTRAVALQPLSGIVKRLKDADPEVQAFAATTFGNAYRRFPRNLAVPGGQNMTIAETYLLDQQAWHLSQVPGGFDELFKASRERFTGNALPHKDLYMRADASQFGPDVQQALKPLVLNYLIPKYMAEGNHIASNKEYLREEAGSTKPYKGNFYRREPRMAALVRLYNRIGMHDYDWKVYGPDLDEIEWEYHTFDPPEEKLWSPGWRYRDVSFPKGMEDWFTPEFDAKAVGWKKGFAPFGQWDGKLVDNLGPNETAIDRFGKCYSTHCRCYEPMKTLWDKEVLLMRTKVKFPKFEEGHRYRIVVGGMGSVPSGEGYRLYVNGKLVSSQKQGTGRRGGGRVHGYYFDKAFWPDFDKEVTIAAIGFLHNLGGKHAAGVKRQHFSVWLQEMKNPPLPEASFVLGRRLQSMRCAAWQETKSNNDLFQYDGNFVKNEAAMGKWTQLGKVASIDAFDPKSTLTVSPKWLPEIAFKDAGYTDHDDYAWSNDVLMSLGQGEALKMTPKTIDGTDYLFIEAGGFSKPGPNASWRPDHASGWQTELYVMKRL